MAKKHQDTPPNNTMAVTINHTTIDDTNGVHNTRDKHNNSKQNSNQEAQVHIHEQTSMLLAPNHNKETNNV